MESRNAIHASSSLTGAFSVGRSLGRIDRELAGALRDADQLGMLAQVRLNNAAQTVTALAGSLATHTDMLGEVLGSLARTQTEGMGDEQGGGAYPGGGEGASGADGSSVYGCASGRIRSVR